MNDTKLSKLTDNEELLGVVESWFSDASTFDKDWKDKAKVWYGYYNGDQWSSDEIDALQERGQAVITFNHIAPALDAIIGGERQNRPKIRMVGRTLDDDKISQVKTSLYDYIQYESRTDDELDKFLLDACITGRGYMLVTPLMDGDKFKYISHQYVDFRDMFVDPLSRRDDLYDARYIHYAVFVDEDILKATFKDYNPDNVSNNIGLGFDSSSEDEMWFENNSRKRPRLISTWYKDEEGGINTVIWVKGQVLYKKQRPYSIDRFPYVQLTVKRTLDNKPYGFVKSMVGAQDEVNKRHSKALHYLNSSQVLAEATAFDNWEEAKKTLARPDGITKLADGALAEGRVQIVPTSQLAQTHIQLMDLAKSEILGVAGINGAFIGQSGQYESAKKAGMSIGQAQSTLVPFLNKIRIARYDLAYITMKLVPDFYTDEMLIRILQPNNSYAFMPINQIALMDDDTVKRLNDVTVDDVDIIIEEAPTNLNERDEQFAQLLQIQGQTQRPIPMEILLRYTRMKDKDQLANELEKHYAIEEQLKQAQQVIQQLQEQLQQAGGTIQQKDSIITQVQTARAVDKEVAKVKEKGTIFNM